MAIQTFCLRVFLRIHPNVISDLQKSTLHSSPKVLGYGTNNMYLRKILQKYFKKMKLAEILAWPN